MENDYDFDAIRHEITVRLMNESGMEFEEANVEAANIIRTGCLFNPENIECFNKNNCEFCGHNPKVAKDRLKGIWQRRPGTEKPVGRDKRLGEETTASRKEISIYG